MTRHSRKNINALQKVALRGTVLTSSWLKAHDVSSKLAWWYVKSGWFERVGDGAYKFAADRVTWMGAVHALQQQLKLDIHVGGKTALQLLGKSHYLSNDFSQQKIQLFSAPGNKLPAWFNKSECWPESFKLFSTSLFGEVSTDELGCIVREFEGMELRLSSPERAAIELCYLIPKVVSFEEAAQLIENLSRLRPDLMQELLQACQSIKAKRLVLFFAEFHQHKWLEQLNLKKIRLGKGKQVIAGGGHYDKKYRISVPKTREEMD